MTTDESVVGKKEEAVCPESTIDSANMRNYVRKPALKQSSNNNNKLACESTIESSLRRDFIRKAVLVSAAAGVGGVLLGKNLIPESSLSSKAPDTGSCSLTVSTCLFVGTKDLCNGNLSSAWPYGFPLGLIRFGCSRSCPCKPITAIGSQQSCSTYTYRCSCPFMCFPPGKNPFGLDFYTACRKVMSITEFGKVGIGTCTPSSTLCVVGTINANCGVTGRSPSGAGVVGFSTSGYGVSGCSSCGVGVLGWGLEAGVTGESLNGPGVQSESYTSLVGKFKNVGGSGDRSALVQFENADSTPIYWNAGVAGLCNACKIPDGSFYVGQPSKPNVVVNTSGYVGIGTITPGTALHVNGGVSAKVASASSNYSMSASDFGVLANATSAGLTVTLPAASTALGMIVFIKKVDSSANAVKIAAAGSNLIESKSSQSLSVQFASLYLISDGVSNWYMIANENVDSSYGR